MKKWPILFTGLLSSWADVSTTWLASKYPELVEANPLANPFLELGTVLGAQALILYLGEKFKVDPKMTNGLALVPIIAPLWAAAGNVAHVAIIEARTYPWKECPVLYP